MKKIKDILHKSRIWMESFAEKRQAMWFLFLLSLAEASFFPIPPDILLLAMGVATPKKAFKIAAVTSIGSVIGAMLGYFIGFALFETIGSYIVEIYNGQEVWKVIVEKYNSEIGVWFLAGAAFSPIPFKIATIAAGATTMPFLQFIIVCIIGRSLRFFAEAVVIYFFGEKAKDILEKYFDKITIAFLLLIILGFVLVKYIFI
ncbi:MAG: DedA family protein [Ignavibacteria bacterium]|jgi:membrane protein YqaA with SNARE-associated domain|nr:DedA family protein [Ignavibacteria bacterium]